MSSAGKRATATAAHDFVRDKDGNGAAIMFCEVAAYAKSRGSNGRCSPRRSLRDLRLFRGEKWLAHFRRSGRRGQDQTAARIVRRRAACGDAWIKGGGGEELRAGNVSRRGRRRNPEGKNVDLRTGRSHPHRRARLGHGAQDQVLPLRSTPTERREIGQPPNLARIKEEVGAHLRTAVGLAPGRCRTRA